MQTISLFTSLIQSGRNDELKMHLQNSALATQNTEHGISLLQFAAYCRNQEAIEMLRKYKTDLDIYEASSLGEIKIVESILKNDISKINSFSPDGFTALGLACFFGHFEVAKFLLSFNANPNLASANSFKVTPLHSACAISNLDIANLLIHNGADVNARQQQGVTPLHSAAHNGQLELVMILIKNGADVAAKMENGKTAADMATENRYKEIAEIILLQSEE